jgi:hypothetical protein
VQAPSACARTGVAVLSYGRPMPSYSPAVAVRLGVVSSKMAFTAPFVVACRLVCEELIVMPIAHAACRLDGVAMWAAAATSVHLTYYAA